MNRNFVTVVTVLVAVVVVAGVAVAFSQRNAGASGAQPGPTPGSSLPSTAPVVAFYGDSYTLGTGASSAQKRWSTIICNERQWREVNPSTNGLGFINNRSARLDEPDEVIAAHPDIVFITMGLNDNFSYNRAAPQIKK